MKERTIFQKFIHTLVDILVLLSLAWFIVYSFFSLYRVSGHSMEPALSTGDTVLIDELSYRFIKPKRMDIVLFQRADKSYNMKRIVGLPGETVIIQNGRIYINGELLERKKQKGILSQSIKAMVLGIPNVGKSTFINAYVGKATAKTGNKPGVTKGAQWIKIGKDLQLLDTPGITWPKFEREIVGLNLALIGSINDEILPIEELIFYLLKYLTRYYGSALVSRYGETLQGKEDALEAMDAIAVKRACIKKGGDIDYTKVSRLILDDFRSGRLGRISLEHPMKWEEDSQMEV